MRYVIVFIILFINWVIWSGLLDLFHLSLGVISCLIVTFMSHDLLFKRKTFKWSDISEAFRFFAYIPWLLYQIILSNIHVAKIVLKPEMPIDPDIVPYQHKLKKDISITTFANSIILTPGTITALIVDDKFYVHCLDKKVAEDLLTGEMEQRVAKVFGEDK
ncbi:MAG: Na+/H+ antiporter subunit E [Thermodesulfovibrionales bacterium]|nr:Na+/H+ antiporter subunit E [Thermodesulfovibrionales bacterium]